MRKIKILQFPVANSKGGITQYVLRNWKWMDKDKFQCDFVTMSKSLDFADEILATGSRIFYLSCYAEENREQFIKEFNEILDENYDIVHLHTKQWKSFLMEEICKKRHVSRVIVHAHSTGIDISDPIRRGEEEQLHERIKEKFSDTLATDFWACSQLAGEFLFGDQISKRKIRIMPNAIETDQFVFNCDVRSKFRKEYGLENCFVIGHVGRFEHAKNHEYLMNVFFEVLKKIKNARLVLVGNGELLEKVQEQAKRLCIEDKTLFVGRRDDISNWYQIMDVFCFPSRFEGFPIALVEAQAAGVPCIASTEITDEIEISDKIVRLPLMTEEWIKQILIYYSKRKENSRVQKIDLKYDIGNQIKEIQKFYEESGHNQKGEKKE